jgi:hypothetical protein
LFWRNGCNYHIAHKTKRQETVVKRALLVFVLQFSSAYITPSSL